MRRTYKIGVLLLMVLFSLPKLSAADEKLSILITAPDASSSLTSNLRVSLELQNASDQTISFEEQTPLCDYQVQISDRAGALLPKGSLAAQQQCESNAILSRDVYVTLRPGEKYRTTILLHDFVEGLKPGTYNVLVSRKFTWGTVSSNKILITAL